MPTISADDNLLTVINVFTIDPSDQMRLVQLLERATDSSVVQAPGFISASLHRSLDGTKVTMYSQWRSLADYQAMREDPRPLPIFREALTFATFEPGTYEVLRTYEAEPATG